MEAGNAISFAFALRERASEGADHRFGKGSQPVLCLPSLRELLASAWKPPLLLIFQPSTVNIFLPVSGVLPELQCDLIYL